MAFLDKIGQVANKVGEVAGDTFDYSKAKEELGYQTRSYQETIHDEVKWLESAGKIRTAKETQSSHQKREALAG